MDNIYTNLLYLFIKKRKENHENSSQKPNNI